MRGKSRFLACGRLIYKGWGRPVWAEQRFCFFFSSSSLSFFLCTHSPRLLPLFFFPFSFRKVFQCLLLLHYQITSGMMETYCRIPSCLQSLTYLHLPFYFPQLTPYSVKWHLLQLWSLHLRRTLTFWIVALISMILRATHPNTQAIHAAY